MTIIRPIVYGHKNGGGMEEDSLGVVHIAYKISLKSIHWVKHFSGIH